jgi:hypothetical protein
MLSISKKSEAAAGPCEHSLGSTDSRHCSNSCAVLVRQAVVMGGSPSSVIWRILYYYRSSAAFSSACFIHSPTRALRYGVYLYNRNLGCGHAGTVGSQKRQTNNGEVKRYYLYAFYYYRQLRSKFLTAVALTSCLHLTSWISSTWHNIHF